MRGWDALLAWWDKVPTVKHVVRMTLYYDLALISLQTLASASQPAP